MELIKVCVICLLMVRITAGHEEGTDGLLSGLIKVIKTEVSNQMKIERKTLEGKGQPQRVTFGILVVDGY